ncbi:glutamyl-tRNA reductase [Sulfurimonas aquatica]|uniref:Glutamyl-tRNA reductase n=1 Tax=Sulfurimonas aquatica TaxID=2672570 RepID=A0A975B0P6_9BACT|nr:glutamyl-tRNA reductase [Sulfurimonas aquatica]QSZ42077.1 glutamyl-tRNA reductase [Sulfurimonas aquatica]
MHYLNISFTHKNSTMQIREKLSHKDDDDKKKCLERLLSSTHISEAILISTCNRMEVLCNCSDIPGATEHIFNMLSNRSGISIEELEGRADVFDDSSAIHHLFSVAASLDSMVIGETQIVGQLKDAFRLSYDNQFCSKKLARAMKSAFKCAAKVRNSTDISSKPVSMASVAVAKLKSLVDDISGKKALVIGTGEMSEITAKHLVNAGADVYIMNRTKHKAEALALECKCKVINFEELASAVNDFEILFTATSSSEPIITDSIINARDFDRYWFDLALPRDINYNKGERIHLYVIDDLKIIVDENMSSREHASRVAHGIIGRGIVEFFEWLNTQDTEQIIKEIYQRANIAAKEESTRAIKNGYIPKEYEEEALKLCEQTLKRFLHNMTASMRNSSQDAQTELLSGAMSAIIKENN